MTNWQMFKVVDVQQRNSMSNSGYGDSWSGIKLDGSVQYADSYKNYINVDHYWIGSCGRNPEHYIEIDIDKTKYRNSKHIFRGSDSDAWRIVPQDVVAIRNGMINASSADPTALTITREGIDKINRGEIGEFEYRMEDRSGNKHHWIYRK